MRLRKALQYLLAGAIGYLVTYWVVVVLWVLLTIVYFWLSGAEGFGELASILFGFSTVAVLVVGVGLGISAYRADSRWADIFRPQKYSVFLSVLLSATVTLLVLVFFGPQSFLNPSTFQPMPLQTLPLAVIIYSLAFYPFSALWAYLRRNTDARRSGTILLLLGLLNPVFILAAGSLSPVYTQAILYEPCGVIVTSFNEPSAARDAGVPRGAVITMVQGVEVETQDDLRTVLGELSPQSRIVLVADEKEYVFTPGHANDTAVLGINIAVELCEKDFS